MGLPSEHEVVQYADKKDEKGNVIDHPVLDDGDFHVKGVINAFGAGQLASDRAELKSQVISLERTAGGGIAYEFAIKLDYSKADAADAAAAAKSKADALAAEAKAKADAANADSIAAKAKAADNAALAELVAAAVAKAVAK